MSRTVLKIAGENGVGGLSSVGNILQEALKNLGFYIHSEREFPSTIKGGIASNSINFSSQPIRALSKKIDIALALDREGVKDSLETLKNGGVLIHAFDRWPKIIKNLPQLAEAKNIQLVMIPGREVALGVGGGAIMSNTVLLGFVWRVLGLDFAGLESEITEQFAHKPEFIEINITCARAGYDYVVEGLEVQPRLDLQLPKIRPETILIDGNKSLALGAVAGGVRAYFAYPMSPSTSILVYLAKIAKETGMLVRQAEDEITVVQNTLGAMHAGTRALCSTSGGGLDLMGETISLAGMIETPLVIIDVQRPGPATGLPTWTGQADLDLAINIGHGEYARMVLSVGDNQSCFEEIQKAMNWAEKFQIPVIVLSEATTGMSYTTVKPFEDNLIPIERGLLSTEVDLKDVHRYEITESGVSSRWLPGSLDKTYFANGDEHWIDGELTEDIHRAGEMLAKRNRKLKTLLEELPEPELYGSKSAPYTIVGWGGTIRPVLDSLDILGDQARFNYLHYTYLHPLKTGLLESLAQAGQKFILVEGNQNAQLGNRLEAKSGVQFESKVLKWDGRPFYIEDILDINENL